MARSASAPSEEVALKGRERQARMQRPAGAERDDEGPDRGARAALLLDRLGDAHRVHRRWCST